MKMKYKYQNYCFFMFTIFLNIDIYDIKLLQLFFSTMFGKISYPGRNNESSVSTPKKQQLQKTKIIQKQPKPYLAKRTQKKNAKIDNSLKGSKFRVLNQLLYTRPSKDALTYFKQNQQDFDIYHEGFRQQANKWSQNPLDSIINYLRKNHSQKNKLILDLGCGEAQLHEKMSKYSSVRSFDLVAKKQFVQVADISNLPVDDQSADACVFCLSLMGLNYIDFLIQARRVLKQNGELLIAEVESRSKQWKNFIKMVQSLGFECTLNKTNNYFRLLYFTSRIENKKPLKIEGQFKDLNQYSKQILGSCLYKKR